MKYFWYLPKERKKNFRYVGKTFFLVIFHLFCLVQRVKWFMGAGGGGGGGGGGGRGDETWFSMH